jgi:hypothetical protein
MSRNRRPPLLHPFLFALYPVLYLYAGNIGEARGVHAVGPALVVLAGVGVLLVLGRLLDREGQRSGIFLSALVVLFFSFSALTGFLGNLEIDGFHPFRLRLVVPTLLLSLVFLGFYLKRRTPEQATAWTSGLNLVSGLLVGLVSMQALWGHATRPVPPPLPEADIPIKRIVQDRPDFYVLILDEFGRQDILKEQFGLDLGASLQALREMGFAVAEGSAANYSRTQPSISSLLNLDYHQELQDGQKVTEDHYLRWIQRIRQNRLFPFLHSQGYRIRAYTSAMAGTDGLVGVDEEVTSGVLEGEFVESLVRGTPIPYLLEILGNPRAEGDQAHARRIRFIFSDLENSCPPHPTFTLAHILCPHPPYVFHADGRAITRSEMAELGWPQAVGEAPLPVYRAFYPEQTQYAAVRIEAVARAILARPGPPPVVLIVSDHGPQSLFMEDPDRFWKEPTPEVARERLANLVALYAPGVDDEALRGITLVNAMRLALHQATGADLPPLPDRCFFIGERVVEFPRP